MITTKTLHGLLVALFVAAPLALSGCSGGGTTAMPDDGTTTPPDDGDSTPPDDGDSAPPDDGDSAPPDDGDSAPPDDGDSTPPDDGDSAPPDDGDSALTVPQGLVQSTVPPLFYREDADDDGDVLFGTLSSGIRRDYDEQRSEFANDAHIKSIEFADIEDEGESFNLNVTYVVGDEEVTVRFTGEDRDEPDEDSWEKTVDGIEYWGWLSRGQGDESVSFISGLPGYRLYATVGFRTATADLPSGTAVYEGFVSADTHLTDDPSSGREVMRGSLHLTANFDEGSLEGRISDVRVRPDDPRVWSDLPDTTHFAIDNGQIVDGQFTASLTGVDSNANAPADETLRGYEGGVLGEFYGSEAAEVGGVLNASRDNRVMAGAFGGTQEAQFDPDRLAGSPRTAVSVGVNRDFNASITQLTDAVGVTTVESDGADGFYVTYMVDGATERVHLPVSGYDFVDNVYDKVGPPDYGIWQEAESYYISSEFDYFSVNGWYTWNYVTEADGSQTSLDTWRGHMVYGEPTATMPAGTAQYAGRVYLNRWDKTDPSSASGRARLRGSLALTADFDGGTIGGSLDDWSHRGPDQSSYSDIDSAELVVRNGTITNNQLSAELTGRGEAADFTGNMTGLFFGPGAAEVGGVIDGQSTDDVFEGWFGGDKQ